MTGKQLQEKGYESSHLDDMVHDAASTLAASVNNSGIDEQLQFLLDNGWSLKDIINRLESRDDYCPECRVSGHDVCPLTPGCPCCDHTMKHG